MEATAVIDDRPSYSRTELMLLKQLEEADSQFNLQPLLAIFWGGLVFIIDLIMTMTTTNRTDYITIGAIIGVVLWAVISLVLWHRRYRARYLDWDQRYLNLANDPDLDALETKTRLILKGAGCSVYSSQTMAMINYVRREHARRHPPTRNPLRSD